MLGISVVLWFVSVRDHGYVCFRQLLDQPSELRSLDHLARLFQKQLLEVQVQYLQISMCV